MKRLLLGTIAVVTLASPTFAGKMVCKDSGKEVDKCCCSVKAGKFVCAMSKKKTHDKCCCESKS